MTRNNTEYRNIIDKEIVIIRDGKNVEMWVKAKGLNDVMC